MIFAHLSVFCFLSHQVSFLEKKVAELENEILLNGDIKSRLKQENTQLVHRYGRKEGRRFSQMLNPPTPHTHTTNQSSPLWGAHSQVQCHPLVLVSSSQGQRAGGAAEGPGDSSRAEH